jgi:hypothetical protein
MFDDLHPSLLAHLDDLPDIVGRGLEPASAAANRIIADRLRDRGATTVPHSGDRALTEFVPFQLAPGAPMLRTLAPHSPALHELVYLPVRLDAVLDSGAPWWIYDGSPTDPLSVCGTGPAAARLVDRTVLTAADAADTADDEDRTRRRAAELLVAGTVPFDHVPRIVVASDTVRAHVTARVHPPVPVEVVPDWYSGGEPPSGHVRRCPVAGRFDSPTPVFGHALRVARLLHARAAAVACHDIVAIHNMIRTVAEWFHRPAERERITMDRMVISAQQRCRAHAAELAGHRIPEPPPPEFAAAAAAVARLCLPLAATSHALRLLAGAVSVIDAGLARERSRLADWILEAPTVTVVRHRAVVARHTTAWLHTLPIPAGRSGRFPPDGLIEAATAGYPLPDSAMATDGRRHDPAGR